MAKSRGGLGRGLAALIPTGPRTDTVSEILLNQQPAGKRAKEAAQSLARSESDTPEAESDETSAGADGAAAVATPTAAEQTATKEKNDAAKNDAATTDAAKTDAAAAAQAEQRHAAGEGDASANGAPGGDEAVSAATYPRYEELPLDAIRPNPKNPRTVFDEDALAELAHSIKEFGVLQPIVVRPVDDGYELVMGERRWRAAQRAGVATVSAIVRRTEDAEMLRDALLENIHRSNLNPLEEAAAYQQLLEEFDVTHDELASRLGRSRPVVSNTIRLLALPVPVQRRVAAGVLSAGHARALLSLDDPGAQEELAARIVAEGLSVRGTEEAVTLTKSSKPRKRPVRAAKMIMPGVEDLAERLSDEFDTKVRVELGRHKGKVVVEFATVDDLERIIQLMAPAVARARTS